VVNKLKVWKNEPLSVSRIFQQLQAYKHNKDTSSLNARKMIHVLGFFNMNSIITAKVYTQGKTFAK
jgi:hypothetical protein